MTQFRFKTIITIEALNYAEAIIKLYEQSIETIVDDAVLIKEFV